MLTCCLKHRCTAVLLGGCLEVCHDCCCCYQAMMHHDANPGLARRWLFTCMRACNSSWACGLVNVCREARHAVT